MDDWKELLAKMGLLFLVLWIIFVQMNFYHQNEVKQQMSKIPVIFRKWKAEPHTIIALFPTVKADNIGFLCQSYEHIGQHGGADYSHVISRTVPAKPEEYDELLAELIKIGYNNLDIRQRR